MLDELLESTELWLNARDTLANRSKLSYKDIDSINKFIMTDLYSFIKDIKTRKFKWSTPRKVAISKYGTSKKRVVYIFPLRERMLLGVLYRVLSEHFRYCLSENCFSYKKGVSTITAVQHIRNSRGDRPMYGVKLDISSYFNSVSKQRIDEMIDDISDIKLKTYLDVNEE